MTKLVTDTKPVLAAAVGAVATGGNLAVWMELIKGWAAFFTIVIGAPTAFLILCYWALKVHKAWKFRNQKDTE